MKDRLDWPLRRHFKAAIRFGLATAAVMAIFWGFWSIFEPVPETAVMIFEGSRWWDIPGAFLTVIFYWLIITTAVKIATRSRASKADIIDALGTSAAVGAALGLACAAGGVLTTGLIIILIAGLVAGMLIATWLGPEACLAVSLGAGLGYGITSGLVCGFIVTPVVGAASVVTCALAYGLVFTLKNLRVPVRDFGRRVWTWLTAA